MRDTFDRLFDRFRSHGDVQALGEVFDATAPELLRVAASLVRDANEADDLLQQTFLTAIERCGRYDGERRLVPWLLGILVHHAREERRRRGRALEPARLAHVEPARPEERALAGEVEREIERALAGLSRDERGVLEDYLRADKTPAEIARERGLAPGATRMRIHRGLERLRKALPAGVALGGAASTHGMSAVRESVLRAGTAAARDLGRLAPLAGSGGAGLAGTMGGLGVRLIMGKKLTLAGIACALAAGLWFLVEGGARSPAEERVEVVRAKESARAPAGQSAERSAPAGASSGLARTASEDRAPAARTVSADSDLAGLRGRVVEHDGTPVAGVSVVLIEADETRLFPALFAAPEGDGGAEALPRILAASTVTGADGVFELPGATARALHALGVDLGGERATVRLLEAELAPGSHRDLGDVVLAPAGVLTGTVVDGAGKPVAGARVRAGAIPELGLAFGLQHVAAGGAITELNRKNREPRYVIEFPAWVSELEEKLPLATATTDGSGRFTLTAAAGSLTVLVDAPGFARFTSPGFTLREEGESDLGRLELVEGTSVHGRVLDSDGRAVAGAELRAGSVSELVSIAVFGPLRTSAADGRFTFEHLPGDLDTVVIGRRDALSPWRSAHGTGGELVLELETGRELVVEVLDLAGTPVPAPRFFLRSGGGVNDPAFLAPALRPVPARPDAEVGRWRLGPLAYGTYVVVAEADGFARSSGGARGEVGEGEQRVVTLRLAPARLTEILVRAAATGEPVAGASVTVEERPTMPVARARTDGGGRVTLELPADPPRALYVCVAHPRFAPSVRAFEAAASMAVELTQGARLVARIADPELAREACTLQLWKDGSGEYRETHLPLLRALPREGALELERLAPGEWTWSLYGTFGGSDVLALLSPERMPQPLASGKLVLAEGRTSELALAGKAQPSGSSGLGASLSGSVRIDGRLVAELGVNLCPIEGSEGEALHAEGHGGRFRLDDVPRGHYLLDVHTFGPGGKAKGLVQQIIDVSGTGERVFEFDLSDIPARLHVSSAAGAPVRDAELTLVLMEQDSVDNLHATTDANGGAQVSLPRAGRYAVLVRQPEEGTARGELEVALGGANELALTLSRGVECAGTVHIARGATFEGEDGRLLVSSEADHWLQVESSVVLEGGTASFRLVGLCPGKYRAVLWNEPDLLRTSFELPAHGHGALELYFDER